MGDQRDARSGIAPRGQVAVKADQQISGLLSSAFASDSTFLVRTCQRAQFGSFAFNLGQRPFKIEVVGHVGRLNVALIYGRKGYACNSPQTRPARHFNSGDPVGTILPPTKAIIKTTNAAVSPKCRHSLATCRLLAHQCRHR
jgi:hypothetical protein